MKIKAVIFDYGGVISMPQNRASFFPWMEEKTGIDEQAVREGWARYRLDFDGGFLSGADMYRRILQDNGIDAPSPAFCQSIAERDLDSWSELNPETLIWARELKASGYKIGILTNMPLEFLPWFERAKEFRLLADVEIISARIKKVKPNLDIYQDLIDRINLPPNRVLFFDDAQRNVEGARAAGLNSELFTTTGEAQAALDRYNA